MRNVPELLKQSNQAMAERLTDSKNVKKGDFPENMTDIMGFFMGEIDELWAEVDSYKIDYSRIREEAADTMVYLAFLVRLCDKQLEVK